MHILKNPKAAALVAAAGVVFALSAHASSVIRDIAYDSSIGEYGLGDLYLPDRVNDETPLVLVIHGGGWSSLDRASVEGIADFFQRELGFAAFNIEYRLANASLRPWPQCGEDCVKAAEFVLTDAFKSQYGLKHKKIWITGGSAGGHLVLWTLVHLDPSKVEGAVSVSAIGDPQIDFAANPSRYNSLFAAPVTAETVVAMDPRPYVTAGMAPLLCTHADTDAVVPIASHRAFETAYTNAGNRCTFFEYASDCEPNTGGHCIWRSGVSPHKLLAAIEGRIRRFVQEVRGLSAPVKLPYANGHDVLLGSNDSGEEVVTNLVSNGTVWKSGAGRTTYVAPALYGSGELKVTAGTAALDFRTAPAVPEILTNLLPKVKLWLDAEKNLVTEGGKVIDWYDCREADVTAATKTHPYASSRFAWMTQDYTKHAVAKPGEPLFVGNSNAFDYVDFGPYNSGNTVVGGKWLSITNTAASGGDAQWGRIDAHEMFAVVRRNPSDVACGLGTIISLAENTMSSPLWTGSSIKLYGSTGNTRADKGATRVDRADVWGEDLRLATDNAWHLISTRMATPDNTGYVNQIGCDRILAAGGMQIAELILFTDRLSEIDRMRIEDYLWKKHFGARQTTFGKISIDRNASVEMDGDSAVAGSLAGGGTLKVSGSGTVTARNAGFDGAVELATGSSVQTDDIPLAFSETSQKITVSAKRVATMGAGTADATAEVAASKPVAIAGVKAGTKKLAVSGSGQVVRIAPPAKTNAVAAAAAFPNADFEKFSGLSPNSEVHNFTGGASQCATNENWVFDRSMYSSGSALVVVMFTNSYLNGANNWNTQTRPWPGLGWDGRSWAYLCKGEISGFFTVPAAGYYRLQFRASARSSKAHKDITLKIDDTDVRHVTSFDWSQFLRYEAELPYLAAGEHKVTFSDVSGNTQTYTFDDVKVLPVQLAESPATRVTIANPSFEEPFSNLGTAVSDLDSVRLFVPVEANLSGWTITGSQTPENEVFTGRIRRRWFDGVTDLNSSKKTDGKHQVPDEMPDGFLAARLSLDTEISQTVTFPSAGRYRLVFHLAKRDGCDEQKVRVKVGDDLVKYVWVRETFFKRREFVFDIDAAGEKTLSFAAVNAYDANSNSYTRPDAFLDAISCERIGETPVNLIADGGFELAPKSCDSAEFKAGGVWGGAGCYYRTSGYPTGYLNWPSLNNKVIPDVPTTGEDAALMLGTQSEYRQIVKSLAAGRYELSFTVRTAWRGVSDAGDWELAVFAGEDAATWNKLWFETALDARDERRITVPFEVEAAGDRTIGFRFVSPNVVMGYAVIDDVELVAVAPAAGRTDLADYLPEDLEISVASGAQLLLDFDGVATVGKVKYAGGHTCDGKSLHGEISNSRFPTLIQGRGKLYVKPCGMILIFR